MATVSVDMLAARLLNVEHRYHGLSLPRRNPRGRLLVFAKGTQRCTIRGADGTASSQMAGEWRTPNQRDDTLE